jgi:uncharacterized membrane protein (DUF485 family)
VHDEVRSRKRLALYGSIATIVLFFAFPILAVTTPVFDGITGGVGVFYLVAVVELFGATIAAVAYCRWADRAEGR